jgi:hypothetical protein
MTVGTQYFDANVLSSYFALDRFMETGAEQEIASLSELARQRNLAPSPERGILYNRWEVIWMHIKEPFEKIAASFLRSLKCLLKTIGRREEAIQCKLLSVHLTHSSDRLDTFLDYENDFLCPAVNIHRLDTPDIYLHPPIPSLSLKDKLIQKLIPSSSDEVEVYSIEGVCRGMSYWFLYLFKRTLGLFQDHEEHLKAIAKFFENGATRQAAVLQALPGENKWGIPYDRMCKHPVIKLQDSPKQKEEKIHGWAEGAYSLRTRNHGMAYIKYRQDLGYVFDPNNGLIRLQGDQAKKLDQFMKAYYPSYPYTVDLCHAFPDKASASAAAC